MNEANRVPARAKQAETTPPEWYWVDRTIWMERMLAALGDGVKVSRWSGVGQMNISLHESFSLKQRLDCLRVNHDEETTDGRAVCGRTARTVLREGRAGAFLYPYQRQCRNWMAGEFP